MVDMPGRRPLSEQFDLAPIRVGNALAVGESPDLVAARAAFSAFIRALARQAAREALAEQAGTAGDLLTNPAGAVPVPPRGGA